MAKKNHMPRRHDRLRPGLKRGSEPITIHPAALGEELEIQHRKMQRIITENRLLIEDNTLLQTELTAANNEIHRLGQVVLKLQADKEAQGRELIEIQMKLEDELHASEPLKTEVLQLREEVQDLNAFRQELTAQIQGLMHEIAQVEAENQQLASVRADADQMHEELVEARRAFEYEKANEEQVGQRLRMENNMSHMAHRTEKLQAEQLNANRRAHGYCIHCPLCNCPNGAESYLVFQLDAESELDTPEMFSQKRARSMELRFRTGNLQCFSMLGTKWWQWNSDGESVRILGGLYSSY
ncbi:unnamed protein product [Dovyalis caffra]|uniref:Uncharacterized protein n=1 Tax=Dovyalis caffra TaxID=77055 RepID=A0AAV1R2P6_9ROSI|nr:unnamed protein product [Dovyalis caffra]